VSVNAKILGSPRSQHKKKAVCGPITGNQLILYGIRLDLGGWDGMGRWLIKLEIQTTPA
jgi:hypothetical protein